MPAPDSATALLALRLLVALFLAILFLQSGIDKVTDRKGNLSWLTGHFAKSPLAGLVPLMLTAITALEIGAGALSAAGVVEMAVTRGTALAFWGAVLAAASLVCLFFGQRMAKDYAGAAALPPYFLVALTAIWLLAAPR
jgi:hypothetical protein